MRVPVGLTRANRCSVWGADDGAIVVPPEKRGVVVWGGEGTLLEVELRSAASMFKCELHIQGSDAWKRASERAHIRKVARTHIRKRCMEESQ